MKLGKQIGLAATVLLILYALVRLSGSGIYNPYNSCDAGAYQLLSEKTTPFPGLFAERQRVSSPEVTAEFYESFGILNVYGPDGGFLYGAAVYRGGNGVGHAAVAGSTVYVMNRVNDLYIFRDGACNAVVPLNQTVSAGTYRKIGGVLIREDAAGNVETIAAFPEQRIPAVEGILMALAVLGGFLAIVITVIADSRSGRKRNRT